MGPDAGLIADRFEVIRPLGAGSFGHTVLALDRRTGRQVALKRLDAAADWKAQELFEREVAVLRALRHQGIPAVIDAPRGVLVMEYVEGPSLAQLIESGHALDPAEVMRLLLDLLGILEYLHGCAPPILHRDLKPANIIVRPGGSPALVDFGSVRRALLGPDESGSTVAGTYGYMPYEQYMGQATPASDLYALGATFLHLLSGRPPRAFMTAEGRIEVPDALPGDPRIRAVIARLLRPSPPDRFASADDVRTALLSSTAVVVARPAASAVIAALPPAPRALAGATAELFDRVAPTMWHYMDASNKPADDWGITDILLFTFFSVITAGILPAVFFGIASARRRRLRRFFEQGIPGTAVIVGSRVEPTAFGEKVTQVSYEFEADGAVRRDVDQVLPVIADRWRVGDRVQILFLPDRHYDSVIISTG